MTRARTVVEQAEVEAAERERNREAWNLPRRPVGTNSHAASPGSPETVRRNERASSPARNERAEPDINVEDHHATVQDGLDWQGFLAAYFPGRRRHDLEALTAYGAYKRSGVVGKRSADEVGRLDKAGQIWARSTAVDAWEDEGGTTP